MKKQPNRYLLCLISICIFSGCRGVVPSTHYYGLTTIAEQQPKGAQALHEDGISIAVGPIVIPKNIDRPQIVTRTDAYTFKIHEFHRWAGTLHTDIERVIRENMIFLLQTNQVIIYPWENYFNPSLQLIINFNRFDGELDRYVFLDATYTLRNTLKNTVIFMRKYVKRESVDNIGFAGLVKAKSIALTHFCQTIANDIKQFSLPASNK